MFGTAVKSQYADLAEIYTTNENNVLEGTVFKISESNIDVEVCNQEKCKTVIGIYSTKPAFVMNSDSNRNTIAE